MIVRECTVLYTRRKLPCELPARPVMHSEHVEALMRAYRAHELATESMWAVLLDARQRLSAIHECGRGGISAVAIAPADVLRAAVITGSAAVILVHNHPSGDPNPSSDDVKFTIRVSDACQLIGVDLLDHVIIGETSSYSFLDHGLFPGKDKR